MLDSEIDCLISLLCMSRRKSYTPQNVAIIGWKKRFLELVYMLHKFPSGLTYEKLALVTGVHVRDIMTWMHNMRIRNVPIANSRRTINVISFYYQIMTPMERRYGNISYRMLVDIFILVMKGF